MSDGDPDPPVDPVFGAFCAAGLWRGLGRTLAGALTDAGIRCPDDVTLARVRALPSVGAARAERLVAGWTAAAGAYQVAELIVPVGLAARWAGRAVDLLGDEAAATLRSDPWRLLEVPDARVTDADRLAVALVPGVRRDDVRRGRALVCHLLARAARDGHTTLPVDMVVAALTAEAVGDPAEAVGAARDAGTVLVGSQDQDRVMLALDRYAMAEAAIAEAVARLTETAQPVKAERTAGDDSGSHHLDDTQRAAAEAALTHGFSVLTGGPGTGKSHTIAAIVDLADKAGRRVALAAPTGRAAKRLEELTGQPASTVHRLLGAQGTTGEFTRGEGWPLDEDVIVVDETSMLDVELAAALLEACADGAHVVFVGDPAQLPSIGPGRVLADIVDAKVVPVTELTTLYRQAEGGAIARLATAVRAGDLPPVDAPDREVVLVPADSSATAAHRVAQLVTDSIPRALGIAPDDVQVVTPVHRGPAGTVELNRALKRLLNPGDGTVSGFDAGDRVVATANHLDAEPVGYANGEVGVVTRAERGVLTVRFAAGPAEVSGKALTDLRHGWAVTVHRAQGSEWPAVVAVLPPEAGGMLSRPLVYTALTRARAHLSIVHAAGSALARAVREVGARPRRTRLGDLLAEE